MDSGNYEPVIIADMANGVGGPILKQMSELFKDLLTIEFFNTGEGELNHEVCIIIIFTLPNYFFYRCSISLCSICSLASSSSPPLLDSES